MNETSLSLDETHLRRSRRTTKGQSSDWWKAGKGNQTADDIDDTALSQPPDDSDSESASGSGSASDDSAESVNTYCPPTRRQRSQSQSRSASKNHNRNRANSNSNAKSNASTNHNAAEKRSSKSTAKAKTKQRKEPPKPKPKAKPKAKGKSAKSKSKSRNKKSSDNARNAKAMAKAKNQSSDDDDEDDDQTAHHKAELEPSPPIRNANANAHRRPENSNSLPQRAVDFAADSAAHAQTLSNLLSDADSAPLSTLDGVDSAEILSLLRTANALRSKRAAMDSALSSNYRDILEQGRQWRSELNDGISQSNAVHSQLKSDFRRDLDALKTKLGSVENELEPENPSPAQIDAEYAVLYANAQTKVSSLTAELSAARAQIESARSERDVERHSHSAALSEMERVRLRDLEAVKAQHKMEIEALALRLKCAEAEKAECLARAAERTKMRANNDEVLVSNLKRENAVLREELDLAAQRAQTVDLGFGDGENGQEKVVTPSPMCVRIESALQRMGAEREREATMENLRAELQREQRESAAKRELMREFEGVLERMRKDMTALRKRLNLYELLTATKLEIGDGEGDEDGEADTFECRTVSGKRGGLMQFGLTVGSNAEAEDVFLDYNLKRTHNLPRPGQPLCDEMSFFAKDAPLFLKAIILHAFAANANANAEKK